MKRVEIEAYFYVLIAATFWGLSGAVAKNLFNAGISPLRLGHVHDYKNN